MVDLLSLATPITIGLILIVLTVFLLGFLKKILENAALGVAMLIVLNFIGKEFGVQLQITFVTVLISALGGLAGVGFLILAQLAGFTIK